MSDGMRANIAQHLGRLVELANTERADREDRTDAVERSATRGDEANERAGKLLTTYICDQNRIADALDIIAGAALIMSRPPEPIFAEAGETDADATMAAMVNAGKALAVAHGGLKRALDFATATPEGLAIKADVRKALRESGFHGELGLVGDPVDGAHG